jgi:hypothetical protein
MCCTLSVESTSMPASRSACDVLPALRVARSRRVVVAQLVDDDHSGDAAAAVEVELAQRHAAIFDRAAAERSRPRRSCSVSLRRASRRSPTHDSTPERARRCARLEHRVGLAHARRHAEIHLSRPDGACASTRRARARSSSGSGRGASYRGIVASTPSCSSSTLTHGFPHHAELSVLRVTAERVLGRAPRPSRVAFATRGDLIFRRGERDVRVQAARRRRSQRSIGIA